MRDTRTIPARYRVVLPLFLLASLLISRSTTAQPIIPDPDGVPTASNAIAITGATIVVRPGEVVRGGTIVVRDGLIESVRSGADHPWDARSIDGTGLTIYPGFIDGYSWAGMPAPEKMEGDVKRAGDPPPARAGITPERRVTDLFDRTAGSVDSLRRAGFGIAHVIPRGGTLPGHGSLMLLGAADTARYTLLPDLAIGVTFEGASNVYPATPMAIIATLRNVLRQAALLKRQSNAHRKNPRGMIRPTSDPIRESFFGTLDGVRPLIFSTGEDLEVRRALMISEELDVPVMVARLKDGRDVVDLLKSRNTPTFLSLDFPEDPDEKKWGRKGKRGKKGGEGASEESDLPDADSSSRPVGISLEEYRRNNNRAEDHRGLEGERLRLISVRNESRRAHLTFPTFVAEQGHRFGFSTAGIKGGDYRGKIREAVAAGLSEEQALAALTTDAAALLNIQEMAGTLESGKIGNLVITRGNYFSDSAEVAMTIVDGVLFDYRDELEERSDGEDQGDGEKKESNEEKIRRLVATDAVDPVSPGRSVAASRGGSGTVLIRNGTLLTITEGRKEESDLLIRNGEIAAIGKGLSAPSGATVVDATGQYVMPGIIDAHSHIAVSGPVNEWTSPVTAEVRIGDMIDPYDITIYRALAGGVTTSHVMHGSANPIGGECETIKHRYGEVDPELLKMKDAPRTIKFALGENPTRVHGRGFKVPPSTRMGVEQVFRKAFTDASRYMVEWKRYNGASESTRQRMVPPVYSERLETLAAILRGEVLIHCHSYRADEIVMLLGVLSDFGVERITFQHANEGFKVAPELAKFGAMASVFSDWWAYKFEVYYSTAYNAAILTENGVTTSINSDSPELNRHLFHEASKSMRNGGLTEDQCLEMITINPARQLGVEDRIGSLEVGKEGDVAIFTAHPLSVYTTVSKTFVDGILRFDAENDPDDMRLRVHPEEKISEVMDHVEDHCMEGVTN